MFRTPKVLNRYRVPNYASAPFVFFHILMYNKFGFLSDEKRTQRMNEGVEKTISRAGANGLATAALILGVVAALGFAFVFPPFVFGATAITLGLLSRIDGFISLRAKIGICMGALSMILLLVIIISGIYLIMTNPGLMEDFTDNFNDVYNEVYNELLQQEGGFV